MNKNKITSANYTIIWVKPSFKEAAFLFFKKLNEEQVQDLIKTFKNYDLTFEDQNILADFLKDNGEWKKLSKEDIRGKTDNLTYSEDDFEIKIKKDRPWAKKFYDDVQEMETKSSISLQAPILILHSGQYYVMGHDSYILAFRYDIPVRFWLVDLDKYDRERPSPSETEQQIEQPVGGNLMLSEIIQKLKQANLTEIAAQVEKIMNDEGRVIKRVRVKIYALYLAGTGKYTSSIWKCYNQENVDQIKKCLSTFPYANGKLDTPSIDIREEFVFVDNKDLEKLRKLHGDLEILKEPIKKPL